jgi:hypothetical protein
LKTPPAIRVRRAQNRLNRFFGKVAISNRFCGRIIKNLENRPKIIENLFPREKVRVPTGDLFATINSRQRRLFF